MTTTDAVAVGRTELALGKRLRSTAPGTLWLRVVAVGAVLVAATLAGCGSTNLLGSSDTPEVSSGPAALPTRASAPAPVTQSRVAIAPIMGAPDAVSRDVGSSLGQALQRQRVSLAESGSKPDYTLRGYMVATKDRAATKVSYIFDLTDPAGKRVNRIQGEETATGGDARNAWSAITPEVAQRISDKAATSLASALASLTPSAGAAVASTNSVAPPVGVGAATQPTPAPTSVAAAASPTTGSIDRNAAAAVIVPTVTGAPGDGNTSLSAAMRQELQQAGVGAASPGQKAYSVTGKVTMGPAKEGKQPIKIDWRVADQDGKLLATVSQNNEIQAGTLDGPWGAIANDAAQGAAARIKSLIDESRASAGAGRATAPQPTKS